MNQRNLLTWCLVLVALLPPTAHAQALAVPTQGKPVRVGLIAPLTGGSADFGNSVRLGAELAVKEINESGGLLGRPLELVVRDDKANPDEGRKVSEDLVLKEKVDFTVGFCNTGVAMKSLDVFQDNKHLLMVPCSQGTAVTAKYPPQDSFIFRVAPPDYINARFLINEIVVRRKIRKVAIFADSTGYGEGGVKDLSAELAKNGLAPVTVTRFPLGVVSLAAEMRKARGEGAEALVVYAVGPEQAVAAKSRAEVRWKVPYFAPWPLSFRSVLEAAGPDVLEGTMMAQTVIQDAANERRSSFLLRYFRHSKETRIGSLMAAAQTYDAMLLMLFAAFQTKGEINGGTLKRALENRERPYQGVVTTYTNPFSAKDHDAFTENMVWLGTWRSGRVEFFYAEDAQRSSILRRKD
ncbi:MAG: ABC transporter substrate-binding protein [Rhodoferax sp.]|nr:ABC transporter substrate-binding protein [Rhodoferax sp.]